MSNPQEQLVGLVNRVSANIVGAATRASLGQMSTAQAYTYVQQQLKQLAEGSFKGGVLAGLDEAYSLDCIASKGNQTDEHDAGWFEGVTDKENTIKKRRNELASAVEQATDGE